MVIELCEQLPLKNGLFAEQQPKFIDTNMLKDIKINILDLFLIKVLLNNIQNLFVFQCLLTNIQDLNILPEDQPI